jgi:hypothetical protein
MTAAAKTSPAKLRRTPAPARWLSRHLRLLLLVSLLAVIELTYVAIISAGTFTTWPTWNVYYDNLAEGFRSGHLYLSVSPRPELLAKADPFHPAWRSLWYWDASLHDRHYYLYWGPLPAVLLALVKTTLRIRATVGDQVAVFAFYTIHLVAGALLIVRMSQRLFAHVRVPIALTGLCIVVFAFATPTPYLIATPGVYEAAIAGGQAFLLLGLLAAFEALWRDAPAARRRLLIAAGLAWGFAFACRASTALTAALFVVFTALAIAPPAPGARGWRLPARPALWMASPIAACVLAQLAYNKLRFGAWLDFGLSRQLSTMQFRTAPGYLLPNLYSYLFRPLQPSCRFPFLAAPTGLGARAFPGGGALPRGYQAHEPVAGLVNATPWVLLAGVAAALLAAAVWRAHRAPGSFAGMDRRARAGVWCGASFLVMGTVTGLAEVTEFFASMRFLADVATGLVLAGVWAAFLMSTRLRDDPWPGRITTMLIVALGGASVAIGLLLGVQGYDQMFARHNPELFARWVRLFSRC